VVNLISSCLSFFLSASTAFIYIFIVPTYTTTIITLKPCALNVEFQHFILKFNKISLLLIDLEIIQLLVNAHLSRLGHIIT
jgi:hypothetical protein